MSDTPAVCELHKVHHPSVAVTYEILVGDEKVILCGTGLDNLKACVQYMHDGEMPGAKIGRATWDLAQKVVLNKTAL